MQVPGAFRGPGRQCDDSPRDIELCLARALGDLLDGPAILVPGEEVHASVFVGRVGLQGPFDHTQPLDEFLPVNRFQFPQAADAVADRHLIDRLLPSFGTNHLLDRLPVIGQSLFDPGQGDGECGALGTEAARHLGDKRGRKSRVRPGHVGDEQDQVMGRLLDALDEQVGPASGRLPRQRFLRDPCRDAPQILDQRLPNHDRKRPQLPEAQRTFELIRGDETAQSLGVDLAVHVRDQLERDLVDQRIAHGRAVRQPGQSAAVRLGEMSTRRPDLLFDHVIVVEQPFAGRGDPLLATHRSGHQLIRLEQHPLVVRQSRQQNIRARAGVDPLPAGQTLRMLFQLTGAEQFRSQRQVFAEVAKHPIHSHPRLQLFELLANRIAAELQGDSPPGGVRANRVSARRDLVRLAGRSTRMA